jgi:hypothetical protein
MASRATGSMAALALLTTWCLLAGPAAADGCPRALTGAIPPRPADAPTGRDFVRRTAALNEAEREPIIARALLAGDLPAFLRRLRPVTLQGRAGGRAVRVTICVTPDYLALGSDDDFLRIPMALPTALAVARRFGFVLPTPKMVDAIYEQADVQLRPQPLPAGPQMRSSAYYWRHETEIRAQRLALGAPLGALIAGDKKDLVLTTRLFEKPHRVAIYGWHRGEGDPIQPLSIRHGARYADYSHGVRLVSAVAYVDGRPRPLADLLADPRLAGLLTDEGPVPQLVALVDDLAGSTQLVAERPGCAPTACAPPAPSVPAQRLAAAEPQVIVGVAPGIHDPAAVPVGRAPAAPVLMRPVAVEDEPAALHLGVAELGAAAARHLVQAQRQVHVLGGVAVEVVDAEPAVTAGEVAGGIGVRAAFRPAAAVAARALVAGGGADALPVGGTVAPGPGRAVGLVVHPAHALDGGVGAQALGQVEAVVGRFERAGTGTFPFMRVAQALADRFADLGRLARPYPDHRIGAGNVRELELVDAGLGVLRTLARRVVEWCHVLGAADLFERGVGIAHGLFGELRATLLGRDGMLGDRRVALADDARSGKDRAHLRELLFGQPVDRAQLLQEQIVALRELARAAAGGEPQPDQER